MKTHIRTFFQESSIHGFRYIASNQIHFVEKLLWIVFLMISVTCCGLLIFKIGVKIQEDAMVTYTSDTAIPVIDVRQTIFNLWILSDLIIETF